MMKYLKTAFVLAAICAVASVILAVMNKVTAPVIENYENQKTLSALEEVCCSLEIGDRQDVNESYVSYRYPLYKGSSVGGYILGLVSNGYGGELNIVASFDLDGVVMAVKLVSDSETPGVGKKAENEGYMDKFIGTGSAAVAVPTSKSMLSEADSNAVSGASITFTGISKALACGSDYVKSL